MIAAKINVSSDLEKRFRKAAMSRFGYNQSAISKSIEKACIRWLLEEEQINTAISELKEAVSKDKNVLAMILFGSYSRNDPSFRDIDVGILLKTDPENQFEEENKFASVLEDYDVKFDVNVINKFSYAVLKRIFSEGKILYCADETKLQEYIDDILLEEEEMKARLSALEHKQGKDKRHYKSAIRKTHN